SVTAAAHLTTSIPTGGRASVRDDRSRSKLDDAGLAHRALYLRSSVRQDDIVSSALPTSLTERQQAVCQRFGVVPVPCPRHLKVGVSQRLRLGRRPIHRPPESGDRHHRRLGTSGQTRNSHPPLI